MDLNIFIFFFFHFLFINNRNSYNIIFDSLRGDSAYFGMNIIVGCLIPLLISAIIIFVLLMRCFEISLLI